MAADFSRKLFVGVFLVFQLKFLKLSTYTQEMISLEGNNSCGVYPSETILLECAIVDSTATTVYEINWPDSTTCSLRLLNSRFQVGTEDECLNDPAIARANRIDGDNYISNINITVPNITSRTTHSVIVKCLSDEIPGPVGTATLNIISSDGFPFPGKVDLVTKNPEKPACMFSIDSDCSVDNYMYRYSSSTNCSNCSYNGSVFICNDISPGESCRFSVIAILKGFTSLQSDPIFCIEATRADVTIPSSSSGNVVPIAVGVVVVSLIISTVMIIIGGRLYYNRKKKLKHKQIQSSPANDGDGVRNGVGETSGGGSTEDQTDGQIERNDQLCEDTHAHGPESSTDTNPLVLQDAVDQLRQEMEERIAISEQKSEGLAEKVKSLEEQFEVITADAKKSKDKIAALKEVVDEKSVKLVSVSSLLREKDNRIKDLEDELKKKDDEVRKELRKKDDEIQKKDDELQQCIEEKRKLEEWVAELQHDVTVLKGQMDAIKNNLDFKNEEKPTKLPDEIKMMVQLALSEFQTTLGNALKESYVEIVKMSVAKKAAASNGSEPPSDTAPSNNGQSSPPTNNFK